MITRRNLVWLIPLALFISFPIWRGPVGSFLAPRGGYDPSLANRTTDRHNFTMYTVHIIQSENGVKTAEIEADQARTGDSDKELELTEVDAVLTAKDKSLTYVTSREGKFNQEINKLTLTGEVVVIKPEKKYELYTDILHYDFMNKMIICPVETRLISDDLRITGSRLDYDLLTNAYDIGGRVYCRISEADVQ
ncbi:MAG: LPS export ABC transporter periplasmic protein LptC [Thermodesulfobacteriota bacterium]